jgi:hypothetical protein
MYYQVVVVVIAEAISVAYQWYTGIPSAFGRPGQC